MRGKNRKPIASCLKLPQFTTMNVIDGQAGLICYASLIFYSLTIDNILNIIVLLILAAVSIATLTGENGILTQAQNAKTETNRENLKEQVQVDILGEQATNRGGNLTAEQLKKVLDKYFKDVPEKAEDLEEQLKDNPDYSLKAKEKYGEDIELKVSDLYKGTLTGDSPSSDGPTVTVGEETVTLTKENVKDYLGKVVTNFKEDYEGQEETINIETEEYKVSKKYRLYYVDFDNKYGDGEGTIYLKAECTSNNYELQLDKTDADAKGIRIKQLNPGLYKDKDGHAKTPPDSTNENMQAVTWLLNENNWSSLKNSLKTGGITQNDINYIVGAPSLEMMMDSYNTKYADMFKKTDKPDVSEITPGGEDRRKLWYQYNNGEYGYNVGPCADDNAEYGDKTSDNSVWTDQKIDTMYYPGKINDDNGNNYWLAAPSSRTPLDVCFVSFDCGGTVFHFFYFAAAGNDGFAFCPLVSLKSTVNLKLAN